MLLIHVQPPPSTISFLYNAFFSNPFTTSTENTLTAKMNELVSQYRSKMKEGLLMTSTLLVGYWQAILKDVIIAEHIDLMVIPRGRKRSGSAVIRQININKLSQQTSCPIMTITRNFNASQIHNIVVPVNELLPVKKLTMATYLSVETRGCIYLMGIDNQSTVKTEKGHLMRAYQLLNDFGKLNIQCAFQGNEDTAGSTLAYARNVNANLIVVNPGKESRLRGWWNKRRGKYLCRESDIPVLTVAF